MQFLDLKPSKIKFQILMGLLSSSSRIKYNFFFLSGSNKISVCHPF
jgi:hypothetical protein